MKSAQGVGCLVVGSSSRLFLRVAWSMSTSTSSLQVGPLPQTSREEASDLKEAEIETNMSDAEPAPAANDGDEATTRKRRKSRSKRFTRKKGMRQGSLTCTKNNDNPPSNNSSEAEDLQPRRAKVAASSMIENILQESEEEVEEGNNNDDDDEDDDDDDDEDDEEVISESAVGESAGVTNSTGGGEVAAAAVVGSAGGTAAVVEHKFSPIDERLFISLFYRRLGAPPPEKWKGHNGTIAQIMKGAKYKKTQRRKVAETIERTYQALLAGEEFDPQRKARDSCFNNHAIKEGSQVYQLVLDHMKTGMSYKDMTTSINNILVEAGLPTVTFSGVYSCAQRMIKKMTPGAN